MRIDVEESSARGNAAAGAFFITGERDENHISSFSAQFFNGFANKRLLLLRGGKVNALIRYGHILNIDNSLTAEVVKPVQKIVREHFVYVFGCYRDRGAENHTSAFDTLHSLCNLRINAAASALIRCFFVAFNADYGNKVAVFVKQIKIFALQIGAVCENGEQNIFVLCRLLNYIIAKQRFAARKQNKAYAEV